MGGNPAENHPCGFKWPVEAKRQRNAKMIVVDPRYTRTAAVADMFLQIRAGADIAFLGGVIHYALENQRVAKEYLVNYTNAALAGAGGLQAGRRRRIFRIRRCKADLRQADLELSSAGQCQAETGRWLRWWRRTSDRTWRSEARYPDAKPPSLPADTAYDLTLENPACVYQLLKKHYSRYTPEMVERITGIPKDQFLKAADLFTSIRKDGDTRRSAPSSTRSAGPSTASDRRSFAPRRCCSC